MAALTLTVTAADGTSTQLTLDVSIARPAFPGEHTLPGPDTYPAPQT